MSSQAQRRRRRRRQAAFNEPPAIETIFETASLKPRLMDGSRMFTLTVEPKRSWMNAINPFHGHARARMTDVDGEYLAPVLRAVTLIQQDLRLLYSSSPQIGSSAIPSTLGRMFASSLAHIDLLSESKTAARVILDDFDEESADWTGVQVTEIRPELELNGTPQTGTFSLMSLVDNADAWLIDKDGLTRRKRLDEHVTAYNQSTDWPVCESSDSQTLTRYLSAGDAVLRLDAKPVKYHGSVVRLTWEGVSGLRARRLDTSDPGEPTSPETADATTASVDLVRGTGSVTSLS